VGLDLKPFDCGRQSAAAPDAPALTRAATASYYGAPAPSNNACGLKIRIPPLSKRYNGMGSAELDILGAVCAALVLLAALVAKARGREWWGGAGAGGGAGAQRRGAAGGGLQQPLMNA